MDNDIDSNLKGLRVYPILTDNNGCGFFVGNLFITAAHVLQAADNPYIIVNGHKLLLTKENAVVWNYDKKDPNGTDMAIFKLEFRENEFQLKDYLPTIDETVTNISLKTLMDKSVPEGVKFHVSSCQCIVNGYEGNYIGVLSSHNLYGGTSGSPFVIGEDIIGIMSAGNINSDGTIMNENVPINQCMFLSSKAIIAKLNELGFKS